MGKIINRVRERQAALRSKEMARRGAEFDQAFLEAMRAYHGAGDAVGVAMVVALVAAVIVGAILLLVWGV